MPSVRAPVYRLLYWLAGFNLLAVLLVEWLGHLPGRFLIGSWGEMAVCAAASLGYGWVAVAGIRQKAGENILLWALGLIAANWVGLELLDWLL